MHSRKIILTDDGSSSIFIPEWNEHYHSTHGAIQEAFHVFIKSGLEQIQKKEVCILEIGLGTGLNAFITFLEALKNNRKIHYRAVEAYPVNDKEIEQLNYIDKLNARKQARVFKRIHQSNWEEPVTLSESFIFEKQLKKIQEIDDLNAYDLIYFDAFGPRVQPELWTLEIFIKMHKALDANGILVTYSAKGSVRRAMLKAGFQVEKIPGPPGKREMLRAVKTI